MTDVHMLRIKQYGTPEVKRKIFKAIGGWFGKNSPIKDMGQEEPGKDKEPAPKKVPAAVKEPDGKKSTDIQEEDDEA
uniref:Uncharacterized protein n=1 Tax=viral metagenome TaxID=1070528 RepID=A0A2V0RKQ0_9ZZZZ